MTKWPDLRIKELDRKISMRGGFVRPRLRNQLGNLCKRYRAGKLPEMLKDTPAKLAVRWEEQYKTAHRVANGLPVRFRHQTPEYVDAMRRLYGHIPA